MAVADEAKPAQAEPRGIDPIPDNGFDADMEDVRDGDGEDYVEPEVGLADEIIEKADSEFRAITDPAELEEAWANYEHHLEQFAPEDAKRLKNAYGDRLQELEPNPLGGG